jgi:hypothetical protein
MLDFVKKKKAFLIWWENISIFSFFSCEFLTGKVAGSVFVYEMGQGVVTQ